MPLVGDLLPYNTPAPATAPQLAPTTNAISETYNFFYSTITNKKRTQTSTFN
jgi:hypothetical protein